MPVFQINTTYRDLKIHVYLKRQTAVRGQTFAVLHLNAVNVMEMPNKAKFWKKKKKRFLAQVTFSRNKAP